VLPRRHVLDVLESVKERSDVLSMCAVTLAVDAIKHLRSDSKKDHLVEALELNEFICNMYPSFRPRNRSLLFHVISDLLGLLLYGIPKKRRRSIENLETIDYSSRAVSYPVLAVWNHLKGRIKSRRPTDEAIIDGFVDKIRIEVDILMRYPVVDQVFLSSRSALRDWVPVLSDFYDISGDQIVKTFDEWTGSWRGSGDVEPIIDGMLDRLSSQSLGDFGFPVDVPEIRMSLLQDSDTNRRHNEAFSNWYRQGVEILFRV
jgi:hypothetical protein